MDLDGAAGRLCVFVGSIHAQLCSVESVYNNNLSAVLFDFGFVPSKVRAI